MKPLHLLILLLLGTRLGAEFFRTERFFSKESNYFAELAWKTADGYENPTLLFGQRLPDGTDAWINRQIGVSAPVLDPQVLVSDDGEFLAVLSRTVDPQFFQKVLWIFRRPGLPVATWGLDSLLRPEEIQVLQAHAATNGAPVWGFGPWDLEKRWLFLDFRWPPELTNRTRMIFHLDSGELLERQ